jgi:hypothetical protein
MRFYVYALAHLGKVLYIGKGSGRRLQSQRSAFGLYGRILVRFRDETAAYKAERAIIAKLKPSLNRHPGGNGCWASKPKRPPGRPDPWLKVLCARMVLRFQPFNSDPRLRHIACLTREEARGL